MNIMEFPMIIMAGKDKGVDKLQEYSKVDYKTLIDIHGTTVLEMMIQEFEKSNRILHYYVMGLPHDLIPNSLKSNPKINFNSVSGLSYTDSLLVAIDQLQQEEFILANGDIPFITAETVINFLDKWTPEHDTHICVIKKK